MGEFGVKGVYIHLLLLNEIYRSGGYYKKWDSDDCLLMSASSGVAGDCSPSLIAEVVQGLVRRSLFDKGVFDRFGVLTSAEIQRRFLRIVGNSRDSIPIVKEYFLLDTSSRKDVTAGTSAKLAFFSVSSKDGAQNLKDLVQNLKDLDKEQNRKEQNRKEVCVAPAPHASGVVKPSFEMVCEFAKLRRAEDCARPFFDYYDAAGWRDAENKPVYNWQQKFVAWQMREERGRQSGGRKTGLNAPTKPERPEAVKQDMDRMARYLDRMRKEKDDEGGSE